MAGQRANNSSLSYTPHFLTPGLELRNYCLNVENVDESHTAHNLAISMSKCISTCTTEEQQKSKMKLYVVAANMQAVLCQLIRCKPLSCFTPTLQLEPYMCGNHNYEGEEHSNYQPISFISKIIEMIVAFQLISCLEAHDLLPAIQLGF